MHWLDLPHAGRLQQTRHRKDRPTKHKQDGLIVPKSRGWDAALCGGAVEGNCGFSQTIVDDVDAGFMVVVASLVVVAAVVKM